MHLKTILNHVEPLKGFIYQTISFEGEGRKKGIVVEVRARKNSRPVCSGCSRRGPVYDHLAPRRFSFVPLWALAVTFLYAMRRVNCKSCGVKVERVPWSAGKTPITRSLALYLADWAKLLSWQETARRFGVSWQQVFVSVQYVVAFGQAHLDLSGVKAIGIDEIQYGRGHGYLTVIYQLCGKVRRLLYVGQGRDSAALLAFFEQQGEAWCSNIEHVCTDMWKAYIWVIKERLLNAVHVLDRFHIVKLLNEAVDQVRREEAPKLRRQGIDLLKGMRYAFLKRPENLSEKEARGLNIALSQRGLKTVRAFLWKNRFDLFWQHDCPKAAGAYLKDWCRRAMHSRLAPIQKFVKTMRNHDRLILNWFEAKKQFSSGAVEGMNRRINLITRKSYGYKSFEVMKIALFHTLGDLPEPERTHRF